MVCIGHLWRIMASLALRISTHNLTLPDAFGTITTELTHVVGPSIMSFSKSSFTLVVALSFNEKGTHPIFWTTVITLESIYSFYLKSFSFPIPWETMEHFALSSPTKVSSTVLQFPVLKVSAGPTRRIPRSVAIAYPNKQRPVLTTIKSATIFVLATETSDWNWLSASSSQPP